MARVMPEPVRVPQPQELPVKSALKSGDGLEMTAQQSMPSLPFVKAKSFGGTETTFEFPAHFLRHCQTDTQEYCDDAIIEDDADSSASTVCGDAGEQRKQGNASHLAKLRGVSWSDDHGKDLVQVNI